MYIVCFHWSMSVWGNREPGNYTHIIPMPRNSHIITRNCPFSSIWNKLHNLVIMIVLQIAPRTWIKMPLIEASQHYYHLTQCPLSASLTLVNANALTLLLPLTRWWARCAGLRICWGTQMILRVLGVWCGWLTHGNSFGALFDCSLCHLPFLATTDRYYT